MPRWSDQWWFCPLIFEGAGRMKNISLRQTWPAGWGKHLTINGISARQFI